MELDWSLPKKKQHPIHMSYSPQPIDLSQNFINPFFGYPNCPIIGRYNRGQYRIGETLFQLEFKCKYNDKTHRYECGGRTLSIPDKMLYNLRNIPQVIVNNKAAGIKNSPQTLPESYPVREQFSLYWILSFGELGKDFLNYLNHMYILASTLFLQEKLQRSVHYLPIYTYLPQNSGLYGFQVERGLNFNNYRGQYMSFHLSKGAPAFSPNNMRLGVQGGKIITSKQPPPQEKKGKNKPKYIEKDKLQKQKDKQEEKQESQFVIDWDEIQKAKKGAIKGQIEVSTKIENNSRQNVGQMEQLTQCKTIDEPKDKKDKKKQSYKEQQHFIQQKRTQKIEAHQGFIHFYSSILLEKDYRIYYHWHVEDRDKQDLIRQVWQQSKSVEQFISKYQDFIGLDPLVLEALKLFFPQNI